jgi:nascent polypeptide-associated complex subunit beta
LSQPGNDKVVKNIVKKVGAHPLGVDEINFFRDDNTILHFKNPEGTPPLI